MEDVRDPNTPDEEDDNTGDSGDQQNPPAGDQGGGHGNGDPSNPGGSQGTAVTVLQRPDGTMWLGNTRLMTQQDIDKAISDRLQRDRDAQKRKADEQKAIEEGRLNDVIATRDATISDLTPRAEAAERYATRINEVIDGEIADWPDEVRALDPGTDDVDMRSQWVAKSRALAARLKTAGAPPETEMGQGGAQPRRPKFDPTDEYMRSRYKVPGQS